MKGHSGDLAYKRGNTFVKESNDNIERLLHQAHKQEKYSVRLNIPIFKIPKVITIFDNGYSMEYIDGENIIEVLRNGSWDIKVIADSILDLIDWEFNHTVKRPMRVRSFVDKLSPICPEEYSNYVISEANRLRWKLIPIGYNHGDLTLANTIFTKDNIYLIDFLKTFMRTPLQDIAKLQQEIDLQWSRLMADYTVENVKVKHGYDYLSWRLDSHLKEKYMNYREVIHLFHFMCLCRLFPYTRKGSYIWDMISYRCEAMMDERNTF